MRRRKRTRKCLATILALTMGIGMSVFNAETLFISPSTPISAFAADNSLEQNAQPSDELFGAIEANEYEFPEESFDGSVGEDRLTNDEILTYVESNSTSSDLTFGDYSYKLSGPYVVITKYLGNEENLIIPESIDSRSVDMIDAYAFHNNAILKSVTIPKTVRTISNGAFKNCNSLSKVTIKSNASSVHRLTIEEKAFYRCISLKDIVLSSNVTEIGNEAFSGCVSLSKLELPDSLTKLGSMVIANTSISSMTIPKNIKSSGDVSIYGWHKGALGNCPSLTEIIFEEGIDTIPSCIAYDGSTVESEKSKIKRIVFPSTVQKIGIHAFEGCSYLESITLPKSLTEIGNYAFAQCTALTRVDIPSNVTSINMYAFSECSALVDVTTTYGSSPLNIRKFAFCNCINLKNISLASNITEIGDEAFSGCISLSKLELPKNLIKLGGKILRNTMVNSINIPPSVKIAEDGATYNEGALSRCPALMEVIFENGIERIPDYIAYDRSSGDKRSRINKITLPSTVKEIGSRAFADSSYLETIILPKALQTVEKYAFNSCNALKDIYYEGSEEDWKKIQIASGNDALSKATIHYNYVYPDSDKTTGDKDSKDNSDTKDTDSSKDNKDDNTNTSTDSTASTLPIIVTINSDKSLTYKDGYTPSEFTINVTASYLPVGEGTTFKNVKVTIELPDGLSFDKNSTKKTVIKNIGTVSSIENNNNNMSYTVYTDDNHVTGSFEVKAVVSADNYSSNTAAHKIPVILVNGITFR